MTDLRLRDATGRNGTTAPVTIPDSVTSIGRQAFSGCTNLTSVTIGNSVTNIKERAFLRCFSLTSVTIGNSVTSIEEGAFLRCSSLTNVIIPDGVVSIGGLAFSGCSSLSNVYFKGNAPSLGSDVFYAANNVTVYYLPGTTRWTTTFAGRPTAWWWLPYPLILDLPSGFGLQTNGFGFIISWATNIPVVIEACTNLACPAWYPRQTNTLTDGSSYFRDLQWTNHPARYYRLRWP